MGTPRCFFNVFNFRFMKKINLVAVCVILFALASACEKEQTTQLSKEQLLEIFTTHTDDEIYHGEYDIDLLMETMFTDVELENAIMTRAKKFLPTGTHEVIRELFDGFRDKNGASFLTKDSSLEDKKEQYCKQFYFERLRNNKILKGNCIWFEPECVFEETETCPEWDFAVEYAQDKQASHPIRFVNCAKTTGDTDCDFAYDWVPSSHSYNNTSSYNYIWYCKNSLYRFFMADEVSGFRKPSAAYPPGVYSTFMGWVHYTAMNIAFVGNAPCQQDAFVESTKFGHIDRFTTTKN